MDDIWKSMYGYEEAGLSLVFSFSRFSSQFKAVTSEITQRGDIDHTTALKKTGDGKMGRNYRQHSILQGGPEKKRITYELLPRK